MSIYDRRQGQQVCWISYSVGFGDRSSAKLETWRRDLKMKWINSWLPRKKKIPAGCRTFLFRARPLGIVLHTSQSIFKVKFSCLFPTFFFFTWRTSERYAQLFIRFHSPNKWKMYKYWRHSKWPIAMSWFGQMQQRFCQQPDGKMCGITARRFLHPPNGRCSQ